MSNNVIKFLLDLYRSKIGLVINIKNINESDILGFLGSIIGGAITFFGVLITLNNQKQEKAYDLKMKLFPSIKIEINDGKIVSIYEPILLRVVNISTNHVRNFELITYSIIIDNKIIPGLIELDNESLIGSSANTTIIAPSDIHYLVLKIKQPELIDKLTFNLIINIQYRDISLKNIYHHETTVICKRTNITMRSFNIHLLRNEIIDL